MGIDCKLLIDGEWTSLDRWHVFSECNHGFESGRIYTRSEALKIIRNLERGLVSRTRRTWGLEWKDRLRYYAHWLDVARLTIKKSSRQSDISIYADTDTPEDFYTLLWRDNENTDI